MTKLIVVVTPHNRREETLIDKTSQKYFDGNVIFFTQNKESLAGCYNRILKEYTGKVDLIYFIHHDVILRQHINDIDFKDFTVVGLAGTKKARIASPFLWHLTADRTEHLGAVAHLAPDHNYYITSFGSFNQQAVLIDGVFIGVNMNKWRHNPVWFDENIPTPFHFYDLCFSLDCNLKKHKVGVIDYPITHASPGLNKGFEEWKKGEEYVLAKYQQYQGKTLQA